VRGRGSGQSGKGVGGCRGGKMTQALYAHMNNKTIKIFKKRMLQERNIKGCRQPLDSYDKGIKPFSFRTSGVNPADTQPWNSWPPNCDGINFCCLKLPILL
jgi:hypothetical protein